MMKALAAPELQKRFFDNGVAAAPQTPAEFVKFIDAETATWKKVVTMSGAKVE
jgi:tripartite-type tricarboxylate transporter receptor subunit TctC